MKRLFLLCLWPVGALAADFPDLPPSAAAAAAIQAHPTVRAAHAGIDVGEARRDQIKAGPHEFNLRLEKQTRNDRTLDERYPEGAIGIERGIRLPGKGAKDAALGDAVLEEARHAYGEAEHEAARLLLKSWFDWLREEAAAREWQNQVQVLTEQHRAVTRRVTKGDAARLEAMLSEAQLTQAEAQSAQAQVRAELAAQTWRRHFPGIALPASAPAADPQLLAGPREQWREKILEHNHALALARAATLRQRLTARQADAERLPDPTLGVRVARELGGAQHILGIHLTLPLPGAGRAAAASAARAEGDVAAAREAETLALVEGEIEQNLTQAEASYRHWQRLAGVAGRMDDNARLLDRAWRLGEGQFADLQLARRQAVEARLAATQARLAAAEAAYRVRLDTHELWPLDDGEHH